MTQLSPVMASYAPQSAQRVRDALDVGRANFAARRNQPNRVTRKSFTDRLGLPADASNVQVFAAIDATLAAKATLRAVDRRTPAGQAHDAEDALYASIFGAPAASPPAAPGVTSRSDDDTLYAAIYGGRR